MAWFYSPKYKKKFDIIGYKYSWNFAEMEKVPEKEFYKKMVIQENIKFIIVILMLMLILQELLIIQLIQFIKV